MISYEETVEYMFAQLPMYQRVGMIAIKKDLTNIRLLCSHLGNPQNTYPCIHIAGTNGKGSTAHLIASILQAHGMKVGLYTSPHYIDFRERIKVSGTYVPKEYVVDFIKRHQSSLEKIHPSFFEISVAMAFEFFKFKKVDIAVIETGLGGRLDSTNIINPLVSVITNISLDHEIMLGPDIYTIAKEKAGIIKHEVPVVIGRYQSSCDHIFLSTSHRNNAKITFASIKWEIIKLEGECTFINKSRQRSYTVRNIESSPFILENISTALEALMVYEETVHKGLNGPDILRGIENFRTISNYKGRWQTIREEPLVIVDSAHNLNALESVINYISNLDFKIVHFVIGFVKDKDVDKLLKLFDPRHHYYFTSPDVVRGLAADQLAAKANSMGLQGKHFDVVWKAVDCAINSAKKNELVYIGGSSFVVADTLSYFKM